MEDVCMYVYVSDVVSDLLKQEDGGCVCTGVSVCVSDLVHIHTYTYVIMHAYTSIQA